MDDKMDKINYYEAKIKKYEKIISELTDEEEIERYKVLLNFCKESLRDIDKSVKTVDDYLLPEYRKDGYFNSSEFKEIEQKVNEEVKALGLETQYQFDIIKQEILKNEYGIYWIPFSKERFMPGTIVHID